MKHAFALLCVAATTTITPPAHACSCAIDISLAERVEAASAVLTREVLSRTTVGCTSREVHCCVRVDRQWKGDDGSEVQLTTSTDETSCGVELDVGESYLFFLFFFFFSTASTTSVSAPASCR
jgi:hypothetical protein